jgi:hypothetical protein
VKIAPYVFLAVVAVGAVGSSCDSGHMETLVVLEQRVGCQGEGPRLCLLVESSAADFPHAFYSDIEGFTFEWGHVYTLEVWVEKVQNPPADGSSLRYQLRAILSESTVEPGTTFEISFDSSLVHDYSPEEQSGLLWHDARSFVCADASVAADLERLLQEAGTLEATFRFAKPLEESLELIDVHSTSAN